MDACFCMLFMLKIWISSCGDCSEDTDVFIMSLAFHDKIGAPLFQKCGMKTRKRLIDIWKVAATVGIDMCRVLIGMHAYTGCGTISTFAGKGKAKALRSY